MMAFIGYPLWGDFKYGRPGEKNQGIGLWAYRLGFSHPTRKDEQKFSLLPPADVEPWQFFRETIKSLDLS